jgi:methionine synthase II (cobalamin-independent)
MSHVAAQNALATEFHKKRTAGKPAGTSRLATQALFESSQRAIKKSIPGFQNKVSTDFYISNGNVLSDFVDAFIKHSTELTDAGTSTTLTPSMAISAALSTVSDPKERELLNQSINKALNKLYSEE